MKTPRIVLSNDQSLNGGKLCLDDIGYFQAIHGRHCDVKQYDVGLMFLYFVESISSICRFANNFDVRLGTENLADATTDALVVVHDDYTKYLSSHLAPGKGLAF